MRRSGIPAYTLSVPTSAWVTRRQESFQPDSPSMVTTSLYQYCISTRFILVIRNKSQRFRM